MEAGELVPKGRKRERESSSERERGSMLWSALRGVEIETKSSQEIQPMDAARHLFKANNKTTNTMEVQAHPVTVHRARFVEWVPSSVTALAADPSGGRLALARDNGDCELWHIAEGWHFERRVAGNSALNIRSLVWASRNKIAEGNAFDDAGDMDDDDDEGDSDDDDEDSDDDDEEEEGDDRKKKKKATKKKPRSFAGAGASTSTSTLDRLFGATLEGHIFEIDLKRLSYRAISSSYGGAVYAMVVEPTVCSSVAVACQDGRVRWFELPPDPELGVASASAGFTPLNNAYCSKARV